MAVFFFSLLPQAFLPPPVIPVSFVLGSSQHELPLEVHSWSYSGYNGSVAVGSVAGKLCGVSQGAPQSALPVCRRKSVWFCPAPFPCSPVPPYICLVPAVGANKCLRRKENKHIYSASKDSEPQPTFCCRDFLTQVWFLHS